MPIIRPLAAILNVSGVRASLGKQEISPPFDPYPKMAYRDIAGYTVIIG